MRTRPHPAVEFGGRELAGNRSAGILPASVPPGPRRHVFLLVQFQHAFDGRHPPLVKALARVAQAPPSGPAVLQNLLMAK